MRTEEWFRTRQARAGRRLRQAQNDHALNVGTLFDALGEITDDPPDEGAAAILAHALGCLNVGAHVYLVHEVRRALEQHARAGDEKVDERVQRLSRLSGGRPSGSESETIPVERVREPAPYRDAVNIPFAVVFQALLWAIAVPPEDPPRVVF